MSSRAACPDCSPTHQLNHTAEWFGSIVSESTDRLFGGLIPRSVDGFTQRLILGNLLRFMRATRILKETLLTDDMHVHQRTKVVGQEAQKRGLHVNALLLFGVPTNFFVLCGTSNGKSIEHLFEGLPGIDPVAATDNIDDKEHARDMLQQLGVPTPQGSSFHSLSDAVAYGRSVGFPLIVKPRYGSLSAHTTVNIRNEQELETAIRCSQQVARSFIVEEYIPGNLYRATTVGPRVVAVGHREPPMITGDGKHTVQELFDARDEERKALLVSLGYSLENIPPLEQSRMHVDPQKVLLTGERVALTWKVNLAYGAGVIDVTKTVHPDNTELFERIAKAIPDFPTIGIDFIAPDIAVSWKEQKCACIELNSLPSIDLHHPPIVTGDNHNVAGALLDDFLQHHV